MDATTLIMAMSIPSAVTGFCFWALEHRISARQVTAEKKENARRQNEIILIESVNASMALAEATARAVQRIPEAHCNGDMHTALAYADKIKHKHKDFITEQGIDSLYQ